MFPISWPVLNLIVVSQLVLVVLCHCPAGECWYHIPSPPKQSLRQLSVGRTSVYAVDENSE
jgi:hypothetical protein